MAINATARPNKITFILLVISPILLSLFFMFIFQGKVFADDINTKVVVTGDVGNVANRETTVILTNIVNGYEYNGILEYGGNLIFKNLDYGTYRITCENALDIGYSGSNMSNDEFTLTPDGSNQVVQNITIKNSSIPKFGFYSIQEADNRMEYNIPGSVPVIKLWMGVSELNDALSSIVEGVPIPKGFYYVGGTVDTGLIISDNAVDENTVDSSKIATNLQGNQFVWIPVKDLT